MAMLEVKGLQVYYGVIQALKDVSFEVNQGEVIVRACHLVFAVIL